MSVNYSQFRSVLVDYSQSQSMLVSAKQVTQEKMQAFCTDKKVGQNNTQPNSSRTDCRT